MSWHKLKLNAVPSRVVSVTVTAAATVAELDGSTRATRTVKIALGCDLTAAWREHLGEGVQVGAALSAWSARLAMYEAECEAVRASTDVAHTVAMSTWLANGGTWDTAPAWRPAKLPPQPAPYQCTIKAQSLRLAKGSLAVELTPDAPAAAIPLLVELSGVPVIAVDGGEARITLRLLATDIDAAVCDALSGLVSQPVGLSLVNDHYERPPTPEDAPAAGTDPATPAAGVETVEGVEADILGFPTEVAP